MASNFKPTTPNSKQQPEVRPGTSRGSDSTVLLYRNTNSFTNNAAAAGGTESGYSSSSESDSEGNSMSRIASGTLCSTPDANNNLSSNGSTKSSASRSCETVGFPLGSTPATTALIVPSRSFQMDKTECSSDSESSDSADE